MLDRCVIDMRCAIGLFMFDKLWLTKVVSYFEGLGTSLFLINLSLRVEAKYNPSFLAYGSMHLVKKLWDILP